MSIMRRKITESLKGPSINIYFRMVNCISAMYIVFLQSIYYFLSAYFSPQRISYPPRNIFPQSIVNTNKDYSCLSSLQWRHNGRDSMSNNQPHDCLLNRVFRHRAQKKWKLCTTGPCEENYFSPASVTWVHIVLLLQYILVKEGWPQNYMNASFKA